MDLSRLDLLKKMLNEAKQFADVWDYFLTHFGEVEEFMDLGVPAPRDSDLEMFLSMAAEHALKRMVVMSRMRLVRIAEKGFIHGTLYFNDLFCGLIFFEDINKGLLCIIMEGDGSDIRYVRFYTTPVPRK